jgi:hypothetical protein
MGSLDVADGGRIAGGEGLLDRLVQRFLAVEVIGSLRFLGTLAIRRARLVFGPARPGVPPVWTRFG